MRRIFIEFPMKYNKELFPKTLHVILSNATDLSTILLAAKVAKGCQD